MAFPAALPTTSHGVQISVSPGRRPVHVASTELFFSLHASLYSSSDLFWKDLYFFTDFLQLDDRAEKGCRSAVHSQTTWITICWKVIMDVFVCPSFKCVSWPKMKSRERILLSFVLMRWQPCKPAREVRSLHVVLVQHKLPIVVFFLSTSLWNKENTPNLIWCIYHCTCWFLGVTGCFKEKLWSWQQTTVLNFPTECHLILASPQTEWKHREVGGGCKKFKMVKLGAHTSFLETQSKFAKNGRLIL